MLATLFPASPHFFFFFFRYSSAQVLSLFVSKKRKKKLSLFIFLYQMQLFYAICFNSWVSLWQLKKLIFINYFLKLFFVYQGNVSKFIHATFFMLSHFYSTKQKSFSPLYFFTPSTKHTKGKLKFFYPPTFTLPPYFLSPQPNESLRYWVSTSPLHLYNFEEIPL